jgi:hypothetical protein
MPEIQLPHIEPLSFKERVINTIIYSFQASILNLNILEYPMLPLGL